MLESCLVAIGVKCFSAHSSGCVLFYYVNAMVKTCCGFGHREVFDNITQNLDSAILKAVENGYDIFYTGAMGQFDTLFSSAVRKAKKNHPHIKLICVRPYFTQDINSKKEYYTTMYDDIIIPNELSGIHPKAAIKARNRWIVDNSELVVTYLIKNHGGAYDAVKYAQRKNKSIIHI